MSDKALNIYFCGKGGAGKSYCCNYLIQKSNYTLMKFANGVYQIAEKYFGMVNKDRLLLQMIGTDVGRTMIDENLWITRFYEDFMIVSETAKRLNRDVKFVCDDVRFKNEHQMLKEMGWVGIYLNVPDEIRLKRLTGRDGDAQVHTLGHISETAVDEFKDELIQVDSSGSLEVTYQRLEETLEYIKREKRHGQVSSN
jgi:dephospho-CoA kinase